MPMLLFSIGGEILNSFGVFFFLNLDLDRMFSGINAKLGGVFRVVPYVSSITCTIFSRDVNCFCGKKHKVRA